MMKIELVPRNSMLLSNRKKYKKPMPLSPAGLLSLFLGVEGLEGIEVEKACRYKNPVK